MEEDNIKDLEKYISFSKKSYNFSHDTDWKWNKELAEKIEHLIKAYKELEYKYNKALSDLVQAEHKNKELEEENKIIKGNYYTLCADIQMVTSELGFPEDTIIADEMISMIKDNYIPVSLVEKKIEEYFEDEEWLVEHDLRALCDDEKECREYYTNKKIALKDIKKAILDKLNKLLKNY